jgi:hypothetical protein
MSVVRVALIVVLATLVQSAPSPTVEAQQPPRSVKVGVLAGGGSLFQAGLESLRQRLRELGYVEDQTVNLIVRTADNRADRYPELAAELVRLRVDVVVVQGNPALEDPEGRIRSSWPRAARPTLRSCGTTGGTTAG